MQARHIVLLVLTALLSGGCDRAKDSATHALAAGTPLSTAASPAPQTRIDNIDPSDTVEDPAYAEAGEALVRAAAGDLLGSAAPLASAPMLDGGMLDLAQVYGRKPLYIKFWATWCTPCRQQMPGFQKLHEKLGDRIQFIAVNIGLNDDVASVRALRDRYGMTMPIVIDDGRWARLFRLSVTPQHVLIGTDARFAYVGHAHTPALEQALASALAAPPTARAAPAAPAHVDPLGIGDTAPQQPLNLLGGGTATLRAPAGDLLAVMLFSSWCEWYLATNRPASAQTCATARETVQELSRTQTRLHWLGIAGGPWATEQDLADYRQQHALNIALALDADGALFSLFGVRDVPTVVLIDDRGTLLRRIEPGEADLDTALRTALAATARD